MAKFAASAAFVLLLALSAIAGSYAADHMDGTCLVEFQDDECDVPANCPNCKYTCSCTPDSEEDACGAAAAKQAGDTCGEVNDGCGGTYDCDCGGAGSGLTCVNNKCVADVYAPCAVDGDCADHDAGGVTEEEKKVICDNGICKPTLGNYCGNWANGKETYCGLCVKNCGVKNDDRVCGAFTYAKDDSCEPKFINAKNGGGRFCAGTAVCCAPTQPSYIKSTDTLGQVDADGFGSSCDDVGAGSTCNCPSGLK